MSRILSMELGALTLSCVIAGVYFLRYWSTTRDRFFLWFAAAFVTFAVNWVLIGFGVGGEHTHFVFVVRLAGFLMIIAAIVGKNTSTPKE
ncbi:MAG: DUF5985 family protein [Kofleriaceae bacterium]